MCIVIDKIDCFDKKVSINFGNIKKNVGIH